MNGDGDDVTVWRGPPLASRGMLVANGVLLVLAVAFLVFLIAAWSRGEASGLTVIGVAMTTIGLVIGALGSRTRVHVHGDRLEVRWFGRLRRPVRRDEIARLEFTRRWRVRPELLDAVEYSGRRVFLGLPAGHPGLTAWWARGGGEAPGPDAAPD